MSDSTMQMYWTKLDTFAVSNRKIDAPWIMALESFEDMTYLKLVAQGQWGAFDSALPACGPDGLPDIVLPDAQLLVSGCRFAALLGKIGGSSAAHYQPATPAATLAASEPFPVGCFCIVKVPDSVPGPLFVGFNARSRSVQVETLSIEIHGARSTE